MKKMNWVILALLLCSCQPEKDVVIDNPSDENLTIEFDDSQVINLLPWEMKTVKLKFGTRQITVNSQNPEEIFLDKDNDYLLNPLKETYYLQTVHYFDSERAEKKYLENHNPEKSDIEGMEVNGEYKKIKDKLLIRKSWGFGLDKEIITNLQTQSMPLKGYITLSKIHRKKDLVDEIMSNFSRQVEEYLEKRE